MKSNKARMVIAFLLTFFKLKNRKKEGKKRNKQMRASRQ